jgi:hypothetical protein
VDYMNEVSIDCVALADRHGNGVCKGVPYLVLQTDGFVIFTPSGISATVEDLDSKISVSIEGSFWSDSDEESPGEFITNLICWTPGEDFAFLQNLVIATSIFLDQYIEQERQDQPEQVLAHSMSWSVPIVITP